MSRQPEHTYHFINPNSRKEMQELLQALMVEKLRRNEQRDDPK